MTTNEIFETLTRDCNYYINQIRNCQKGYFLVRGYNYKVTGIKKFEHNIEMRKPRNMPPQIHDQINNYFESRYGWKIRNGAFCYGFDMLNKVPTDLGYGFFSLFFPIGPFDFVYSPDHFDLFGSVNQSKIDISELIPSIHFDNSNFCGVMRTKKEFHDFGNEVSIKTQEYYLVDPTLAADLSSKIW